MAGDGVDVCISEFQNLSFWPLRTNCLMTSLLVFYYCTCLCRYIYFCHCCNNYFNPSFCLSLPFCLFCVAVQGLSHVGILTQQGPFFHC